MLLVDSLYINNSGGKILLDYLVNSLEKKGVVAFYLFDERCSNDYHFIPTSRKLFLRATLIKRYRFYQNNKAQFSKVFCFGNLPPVVKLNVPTFTYFHQKLFLEIPKEIPLGQKLVLKLKNFIFKKLIFNTGYWMVQTNRVKKEFLDTFPKIKKEQVLVLPFYPELDFINSFMVEREKNTFVYVSNGSPHKNHVRLIEAFAKFYKKHQVGKLYLTIGNEFHILQALIQDYQVKGIPIVNTGFLNRSELMELYQSSEYLIFPSLSESFGLGLLEAMENGCKILGADLPYTYAVCNPTLVFDPENIESIAIILEKTLSDTIKPTKQLVFNKIDELVEILKNNHA